MFIVYSKDDCPYCTSAKAELGKRDLPFVELVLGVDYDKDQLAERLPDVERLTVPQIWTEGKHIGGYDELMEYFESTSNGSCDDFA